MKTFILCCAILIVLIGVLLINSACIKNTGKAMDAHLSALTGYLENEDWPGAEKAADDFYRAWKKSATGLSLILHVASMDLTEAALERAKVYVNLEEKTFSLSETANIKVLLEDLFSREKLTLKNIL